MFGAPMEGKCDLHGRSILCSTEDRFNFPLKVDDIPLNLPLKIDHLPLKIAHLPLKIKLASTEDKAIFH